MPWWTAGFATLTGQLVDKDVNREPMMFLCGLHIKACESKRIHILECAGLYFPVPFQAISAVPWEQNKHRGCKTVQIVSGWENLPGADNKLIRLDN